MTLNFSFFYKKTKGSIIEGAVLARLFNPNKTMELEADIMYIVGIIKDADAVEVIQTFKIK